MGDYHHIINVAEQLKKNYENLKIDVIPFIISNNYDSLKKLDNTKYDTHFCKYEILANNPTILEILEKSDLIIHASVPAHNACLFKNKTFYVLEYGQPSLHSMGAKKLRLRNCYIRKFAIPIFDKS